jgi:hypothetical protein
MGRGEQKIKGIKKPGQINDRASMNRAACLLSRLEYPPQRIGMEEVSIK